MRVTKKKNYDGTGTVQEIVDTTGWERARVSFTTTGAAATSIVLAPEALGADSYTLNDGSPLTAPADGATLHLAIGTGTMIGVPLPESLAVGLVAAGAQILIVVELERDEIVEDDKTSIALIEQRKLLEQIIDRLGDVIIELRRLK